MNLKKAVVILSGGQDSTTCLYWALKEFAEVEAITFYYGQRHEVEVRQSHRICEISNVKQTSLDVSFLHTITTSALLGKNGNVNTLNEKQLPASFVPNRNALFITLAHTFAQKIGAGYLVTGVCETDYSGYPDCRRNFIDNIELTLNNGSNSKISILTPLMFINKCETFKMAMDLGCLKEVVYYSHTCYLGDRHTKNPWGDGCGKCPACLLRSKGWNEFVDKYNPLSVHFLR